MEPSEIGTRSVAKLAGPPASCLDRQHALPGHAGENGDGIEFQCGDNLCFGPELGLDTLKATAPRSWAPVSFGGPALQQPQRVGPQCLQRQLQRPVVTAEGEIGNVESRAHAGADVGKAIRSGNAVIAAAGGWRCGECGHRLGRLPPHRRHHMARPVALGVDRGQIDLQHPAQIGRAPAHKRSGPPSSKPKSGSYPDA